MMMTPDQSIAYEFLGFGEDLKRIRSGEADSSDFVGVSGLASLMQGLQTGSYMGRAIDLATSPTVAIIDNEVKVYLQATYCGDINSRLSWLTKKATEAHAYMYFLEVREQVLEDLARAPSLTAVAARLQGEAVDVEAGKYSLRDLQNVVIEIGAKMDSYLNSENTSALA